jgi:hypothetical protein
MFLGELWAGWACARTNQQEFITCAKHGGQYKKKFKKKGQADPVQASTCGWRPTVACQPRQGRLASFFLNFFIFLMLPPTLWSIFYWKFGEWARAFGRMGAQYTHFFKLPPSLGSVKSSIPHRV